MLRYCVVQNGAQAGGWKCLDEGWKTHSEERNAQPGADLEEWGCLGGEVSGSPAGREREKAGNSSSTEAKPLQLYAFWLREWVTGFFNSPCHYTWMQGGGDVPLHVWVPICGWERHREREKHMVIFFTCSEVHGEGSDSASGARHSTKERYNSPWMLEGSAAAGKFNQSNSRASQTPFPWFSDWQQAVLHLKPRGLAARQEGMVRQAGLALHQLNRNSAFDSSLEISCIWFSILNKVSNINTKYYLYLRDSQAILAVYSRLLLNRLGLQLYYSSYRNKPHFLCQGAAVVELREME